MDPSGMSGDVESKDADRSASRPYLFKVHISPLNSNHLPTLIPSHLHTESNHNPAVLGILIILAAKDSVTERSILG